MSLTVTPNDDCTLFEISGQRAGAPFRVVVSQILPETGQVMTPRGYRDADNDTLQVARAAGVPVQAL